MEFLPLNGNASRCSGPVQNTMHSAHLRCDLERVDSEKHPALHADRQHAHERERTRSKALLTRSTSAWDVISPSERRTLDLARASPSMAATTVGGSIVPALHA